MLDRCFDTAIRREIYSSVLWFHFRYFTACNIRRTHSVVVGCAAALPRETTHIYGKAKFHFIKVPPHHGFYATITRSSSLSGLPPTMMG